MLFGGCNVFFIEGVDDRFFVQVQDGVDSYLLGYCLNDVIEVVPDWVWDVGLICSTFWSGGGVRPVVLQCLAEFRVVMYGCGMNVLAELTTDCVRVGMEVLKDLKEYDSRVDEKNGRGPEGACIEG